MRINGSAGLKRTKTMRPEDPGFKNKDNAIRSGYEVVKAPAMKEGSCDTCGTVFLYKPYDCSYRWLPDEKGEYDSLAEPDGVNCAYRSCPGYYHFDDN